MTTEEFFAARRAQIREGVLTTLVNMPDPLTASQLRVMLDAGMRELDSVLQALRAEGRIATKKRRWSFVK